jgi:GH25 family lysozyme M1 (1,4-beta-N-acetylmuramidase)
MNGIDISAYQRNINLSKVDFDFCIVKATEGTYYTSDCMTKQANAVLRKGKRLGLYHFAGAGDAKREANYFWNAAKFYNGKAIFVLDYEAAATRNGPGWVKTWMDEIARLSGRTPVFYSYYAVVTSQKLDAVAKKYPLWIAGYPDSKPTGYKKPEQYKNNGAWKKALIRQYTSNGHLKGYDARLDLDYFFGTPEDWDKLAGGKVAVTKKAVKKHFAAADVRALQKAMGTPVDGVISGQAKSLREHFPDLAAVEYGKGGSECIKALQKKLGIKADGILGEKTVKAIQMVCCVICDGVWGRETTEKFRTFLKLSKARREILFSAHAMTLKTKGMAYNGKSTYDTLKEAKAGRNDLNCALAASWTLQRAGILPEGKRIWLGDEIHGAAADIKKKCTGSHPGKLPKHCKLIPGDICGFQWGPSSENKVHTMIYAGEYGGYLVWFTWGSSDVKLQAFHRRRKAYEEREIKTLLRPI